MPETTIDAAINAAIEHLVRVDSSDRPALVAALRELAGLVDHDLTPKAPVAHRFFGGHWDGDVYIAACGQPDRNHQDRKGHEINCPGCVKTWDDAEPKLRRGERGTCAVCGGEIALFSREGWVHLRPIAYGHDAVLGGPA